MEHDADADVDRTAETSVPTFAVRVRPKFREVVLPPGPPHPRRPPSAGSGSGGDAARPISTIGPGDPARPA